MVAHDYAIHHSVPALAAAAGDGHAGLDDLMKCYLRRHRGARQRPVRRAPVARARHRRRADAVLRRTAAGAAARLGHPDIGSLVRQHLAAGRSLARISRDAGLHKDWLCRHLATVDPATARAVVGRRSVRLDARWLPIVQALGFVDVRGYLTDRHAVRHHTVAAIAAEVGTNHGAVESALEPAAHHRARKHVPRHSYPRTTPTAGRPDARLTAWTPTSGSGPAC